MLQPVSHALPGIPVFVPSAHSSEGWERGIVEAPARPIAGLCRVLVRLLRTHPVTGEEYTATGCYFVSDCCAVL